MKAHRRQLGRFSNSCALFSSVQGGFFKEKATYHRAFGVQQLENSYNLNE